VDAVNNLLDETTTNNGTSTTSFNVLETKLSGLLQDGVGGTPKVCFSIVLELSDPRVAETMALVKLLRMFMRVYEQ
jgi:hypothetical protein